MKTPIIRLILLLVLFSLGFAFAQSQTAQSTENTGENIVQQPETQQVMPLVDMDKVSSYVNVARNRMALVGIEGDVKLGVDHAPLVLIEFSDVNCPYCGRFHGKTLPALVQQYVDSEKMRFVYRDLVTVGGEYSFYAAYGAECVRDQMENDEEYMAFMSQFYNLRGIKTIEKLQQLSQNTAIDQTILTSCIDQDWFYDEVNDDVHSGRSLGFRSTPIFVLGYQREDGYVEGFVLRGALPYQTFAEQIERMIAAAQ